MIEHAHREQVTLLLVNDALEANQRDVSEAALQLLDAAGTLILHNLRGQRAINMAHVMAGYLVDQVTANSEGVRYG